MGDSPMGDSPMGDPGAVDREFLQYLDPPSALPGPPRAPPEPSRADPDHHSLPVPLELSLDVFLTFAWTS